MEIENMDNNISKNEDSAGQQKTDPFKELQEKSAQLEKECREYLNGWKRAKADLINYQKDEAKRFEEIMKFGFADLIKDFIPVLDSFDFAISVLEKEDRSERGVYMIRSQLEDVLRKRGFEKMNVSLGEPFDPKMHESVGEIESGHPDGSIAAVIENGYLLNGRVVRPARVKISKTKN